MSAKNISRFSQIRAFVGGVGIGRQSFAFCHESQFDQPRGDGGRLALMRAGNDGDGFTAQEHHSQSVVLSMFHAKP